MDKQIVIRQQGPVVNRLSLYRGIHAIRHLSFPTSCDIRQKNYGPKVFLLTDQT